MTVATWAVTTPGIVPDLPEDLYHKDPVPGGSLSSGGARTLLEPGGPAKFHYWRGKEKRSATFDLGKAVHTLALGEGALIRGIDAKDWKTKKAQEQRAQAYADGVIPLLIADAKKAQAMVDALRAHPLAGALLAADGQPEQSLFWTDPDTGVWCRARYDKPVRDVSGRLVIVDLKTCETASEASASKSVGNYGYHQQDEWYRRGAVALDLDPDPGFLFVFVEKQPPHLVNVVQLTTEDVEVGRRRNNAALRLYAECTQSGHWPGYGDDITEISLPAYYPRQEY